MKRIAALDGLRGLAILLVVVNHAWPHYLGLGGAVGVTAFFVLSGFLITRILLDRPPLKSFYWRRAVRLLPALGVFLVAVGLVGGWEYVWPPAFYAANYVQAAGTDLYPFTVHTWSLAVEEHFYLVWPLVVLAVPRRRLPVVFGLVVAGSLLLRFSVDVDWGYFDTLTNAYALAAGGLISLFVDRWQPTLRLAAAATVGLVGLAFVATTIEGFHAAAQWASPLAAGFSVVAVWAAATRRVAWLEPRWLVRMGHVSYGWYLWHLPIVVVVAVSHPTWTPAAVVLSYLVAEASTRYVEAPAMRWQRTPKLEPVVV